MNTTTENKKPEIMEVELMEVELNNDNLKEYNLSALLISIATSLPAKDKNKNKKCETTDKPRVSFKLKIDLNIETLNTDQKLDLFEFFCSLCGLDIPYIQDVIYMVIQLAENLKTLSKVEIKDRYLETFSIVKRLVNLAFYHSFFSAYMK